MCRRPALLRRLFDRANPAAVLGVILALALTSGCGGGTDQPPTEPGPQGGAGDVTYEVSPGTGQASFIAEVVEEDDALFLVVRPDGVAAPVAGAQFVVDAGGVELGPATTRSPLMVFHNTSGSAHRLLLFSYTGATMETDEEAVRFPLDASGLSGSTTVTISGAVISELGGDGPQAEDRQTKLTRAGGGS